jgi:hypothetical protein
MKPRSFLVAARSLALLFLPPTVHAQVSFFQPPTYSYTDSFGPVFVADFNGDGKPDLLTDGFLGLGNGDGTFTLSTLPQGATIAVGDFNGDGKADLLQQGTGTLLVLLGNGDGTFKPSISTPSGASLSNVAAIDLNGDGKWDVVGIFNNSLLVYLNRGDGTFAPGVPYNIGSGSGVVTFGDFNGDGKTDVVVSVDNGTTGQEIVFLGNGDGSFQAAKTSAGIVSPAYAAVGDFNGDGKLDLAISGLSSAPVGVYILPGNGDGTFQAPTSALPGGGELAVADLNGDGKLDLVLEGDPTVAQIYLGNGDGTFSNAGNYFLNSLPLITRTPGYPTGIVVADLNLDGKLDVALGNVVLLGNGNGTFQGIQFGVVADGQGFNFGPGPGSAPKAGSFAVIGSFDRNSAPGVAVLSTQQSGGTYVYNVNIFNNNGSGRLSLTHTYALQQPGSAIVTGDFDGDGNLDLLVFGFDQTTQQWSYSVLHGNGDGSFQPPVFHQQTGGGAAGAAVVGDFNNDKKLDLAVIVGVGLAVLLGNGDGTFAAPVYLFDGNPSAAYYLVSADFNGDGKPDIAVGGAGTALLFGNGDGTFQAAVFPPNLSTFSVQFTTDIDNDGNPDLVGVGGQVALGNGNGTFTLLSAPNSNYDVHGVGDLNGDGKPDLLVTELLGSRSRQSGVLLGKGDGTFGSLIPALTNSLPPGTPGAGATVADMNGDSRPDIIFLWYSAVSGVAVILNDTAPGFELSVTALSPATITQGDSGTSAVGVTPTFGFSSPVTLSCVGLPSGANCQFNPSSIPLGSGTSSLIITTTIGTPAGTFPVQIQGSAASLTSGATLSLVVQGAPDFAIAGSPASQTVSAGQSATFNLAVTPTGSFIGAVNLSCSITPAVTPAPTCNLSTSSAQINSTGAASVMVTVGTTAPVTVGTAPHMRLPPTSILLTWAVILMVWEWLLLRNQKHRPILAALLIAPTLVSLAGCGGGASSSHTIPGTPTGTYTTTVTATSGSLIHNTKLQVVVQ